MHPETVSTAAVRIGLAHLVHEINNRMQLVYNAFCVLEGDIAANEGFGDPFMGEVLHGGKTAIEELMSLVQSLRASLESLWQINPSLQVLELGSLAEEILRAEAVRFAAGEIRVAKEMAAGLPLIQGDKSLLKIALRNVVKNAADAMPKGGNLRVTTGAHDGSVYIEVTDTGIGIPPGLDVFQPFATSKSGGMGLGLAIARHIVEVHGGTIGYRSERNEGTTFCIIFPLKVDAKNASASGESAAH
ncbi:MAG: sensor histidine kinase [Alphaproteobacteria bacterium]